MTISTVRETTWTVKKEETEVHLTKDDLSALLNHLIAGRDVLICHRSLGTVYYPEAVSGSVEDGGIRIYITDCPLDAT